MATMWHLVREALFADRDMQRVQEFGLSVVKTHWMMRRR